MNALAQGAMACEGGPDEGDRLAWLQESIVRNRFLPVPPPELQFVGDGDFRAIGAEFLGHFVRIGGLSPDDAVLDIGCGLGRMAVPLTQYLDPERGRYEGVEIVAHGIAWCRRAVTPAYPTFRFHHLDWFHPLYNPGGGAREPRERRLPFDDRSIDFVVMTSVLTHLTAAEVDAYAGEIARLLRPGGRCFATAFLINDEARRLLAAQPQPRLPFPVDRAGPEFHAHQEAPTAAVGFDEAFLAGLLRDRGLRLLRPPSYGHWCGRPSGHYQDICLFGVEG